jgi:lipid-A-disaccharide synthase
VKRLNIMFLAGEPSGDRLAADLAHALRARLTPASASPTPLPAAPSPALAPIFWGAGGSDMTAAGVHLVQEMTSKAVVGLWEVIRNYRQFRAIFHHLLHAAIQRQPDAVVLVDFSGFNLRFARALRSWTQSRRGVFANWTPKLICFVSPQVWASRAGRALHMARCLDLVLSIFPFEKAWYAQRVPQLRVEFVGHPLLDRYPRPADESHAPPEPALDLNPGTSPPRLLLLPGSRARELEAHLPIMIDTVQLLRRALPFDATLVVPPSLRARTQSRLPPAAGIALDPSPLPDALRRATAALACSGTVTMECAYFRLPTVILYRTSFLTYHAAKQLINVPYLGMPNLLAGDMVYPEFIQHAATPPNLAVPLQRFLQDPAARRRLQSKLDHAIASLGPPGALDRAACLIAESLGVSPYY